MGHQPNPFVPEPRDEDEVLESLCRFPKYKDIKWREVIQRNPDYVIWLGEEGLLKDDELFMMELAEDHDGEMEDDEWGIDGYWDED